MKFFNKYNPKPIAKGLDFSGHEEVCNQQLATECEVRNIMAQFEAGKITDLPAVRQPEYNSEFITPQSFLEAKNMIKSVENDFYSLPKELQRQFGDINTYIKDLYDISQGKSETIAKYQQFNLNNIKQIDIPKSESQPTTVSQTEKSAPISD